MTAKTTIGSRYIQVGTLPKAEVHYSNDRGGLLIMFGRLYIFTFLIPA